LDLSFGLDIELKMKVGRGN